MCATDGSPSAIAPRSVHGEAVDPIALEPVDEVVITTLVDNSYDALLTPAPGVARTSFGVASGEAPQFESGRTMLGLVAEQGFSALVTVRRGDRSSTVLFDAGLSPTGLRENATRLDVDWPSVQAVVLSHGHFDHSGGLAGISHRMPMVVHPGLWTRRRLAVPGGEPAELPTLSRSSLENEGFAVLERRHPSLLLDGCVLVTGEVDRVTEYERGMPPAHEALVDGAWQHDPLVLDDQALVVHLRDRGLVVLTGCGHAGAVNIARHAMRLTGVGGLHALVGGLHLGGPWFEPVIEPTVQALLDLAPSIVLPAHCTGWRAQHALAAALPDAWVAPSVGTTLTLSAA